MKYLHRWKMFILIAMCIVITGPLSAIAAEEKPAAKTEPPKPTKVAEVNGTVITYSDFERQLEIMKQRVLKGRQGTLPEALMAQIKSQVVKQLVAEELLFQESGKKSIKVETATIEAELMNLRQRFGTEEQYQQTLKLMKMTEEKLRVQIARQAAIRKLVNDEIASKVEVTEADAKKYFEENSAKFRKPERVRAQHILIKVAKEDDETKKAAARKKLDDLKKKVMGGEDFGELAKAHSEGPSGARGGDLGYFTRGRMVKSFEEAAFKLAPNEVSDIVETKFGYHLIKVNDHQAAKEPSFDEMKTTITNLLRREKVQNLLEPYVAKLQEQSKVETFYP